MIDLQCMGLAGPGDKWPVLLFYGVLSTDAGKLSLAERRYAFGPSLPSEQVCEPRKTYDKPTDGESADAPESVYREDIFTRLDRLRSNASEDSVSEQLERLQGIAALMQQRDQGPMPGEMLRVYAWEVEDAVKIIKKNSGVRIQNSEDKA